MHQTAIDISQIVLVALPAAWLSLGALDNLRHPDINRSDVAKVLALEALQNEPQIRARVAHRAITDPVTVRRLFALIVLTEAIVSLALVSATIALVLALFGAVDSSFAHALAIYAVTGFTGVMGRLSDLRPVVLLLVRRLRQNDTLLGDDLGHCDTDCRQPMTAPPSACSSPSPWPG